ncbi:hypothetical protein L614_001600000620 [Ochrobactrum sp. J50]|jgi:hypothetical protein|nr:hypothetical protein L614_001600000620 [Ochrobactrum sp. J50]
MVSDFKNGRALVQQHRVVALDAMNALVGRMIGPHGRVQFDC